MMKLFGNREKTSEGLSMHLTSYDKKKNVFMLRFRGRWKFFIFGLGKTNKSRCDKIPLISLLII